jgi:hypothetical protein
MLRRTPPRTRIGRSVNLSERQPGASGGVVGCNLGISPEVFQAFLSRTECGSAPVNVFAVVDVNDEHNISRPPAEGAKVPDPQSPR